MRQIYEYIKKDSLKHAKFTIVSIRAKTKLLLTNPLCGRKVPETNKEIIRESIHGNFRIIYKISSLEIVEILLEVY